MEEYIDSLKVHLLANEYDAVRLQIENLINRLSWEENIRYLKSASESLYQTHWLKLNHALLSIFNLPELLGVDCDIFRQLKRIGQPISVQQASEGLFYVLIKCVESQLRDGGSTLFFNIEEMSSTRSATIITDLVNARYRETIFVLNETDEILNQLTKEWIDVSRLWRTANGYRLLKARHSGTHIHVNEYRNIRDCLASELGCDSTDISKECKRMRSDGVSTYLQLSKTLDEFMTGLVGSLGVRGKYDPYYKSCISHEGLDEF
jgi:hypothetical protein